MRFKEVRRLSPAFCAGGVGIVSPVADPLLSGFGDMVCGSRDELEHIPSSYPAGRALRAFGSCLVSYLTAFAVPVQTLEDEGGADHVAADPDGIGNGLNPNACVCGEAAMVPTEHVIDSVVSDELFFYQETKDLGAEKLLEFVRVPIEHVSESAIFQKAAVCNENMHVGVETTAREVP